MKEAEHSGKAWHRNESPINITSIIMVLVLAGISALFLGVSGAYLYTRITTGVPAPFPPAMFFINIPVLVIANRLLRRSYRSLDVLRRETLIKYVITAIGLTLIFGILQVVGWYSYFTAGRSIQATTSHSYLFVLSGLHLLHIAIGLPFLVVYYIKLRHMEIAEAQRTRWRRMLRSLATYWDFLDVLWILLVGLLVTSALI